MKWHLAKNISLDLSNPILMGILNATPDSFSDGDSYKTPLAAYVYCQKMLSEGANIIDIGGESTRPNATKISKAIEQDRILPIVKHLVQNKNIILSIDTYNSETANIALEQGAHIINDVYGLQYDKNMASIIAEHQAGVVIMHTNRGREALPDIIEDQKYFFDKSIKIAQKAGINDNAIALDPGFGFAKNYDHNVELFKRIAELSCFNYPFVAATSRKNFLGTITGLNDASQRDIATAATSLLLRQHNFVIFRVHSIKTNKQILDVYEALK